MHPEEPNENISDHTHGEYEISENQKRYFTPTTEEVYRRHWRGTPLRSVDGLREHVALDRWLAKVRAEAWEEGYAAGSADSYDNRLDADNPYLDGENSE